MSAVLRPSLIEFPADDPQRALRFWSGMLGDDLRERGEGDGEGWELQAGDMSVGVHARGRGPGDTGSLPYFEVADVAAALVAVTSLGGSVVHPGQRWAICRDCEGNPFGLARTPAVTRPTDG